jgi:predicted ATPase
VDAMIGTLAISGYRSLRDVRLELNSLNIVTGANGSGKSSLYRALRLLADIAQGRIVQSLAQEGGLQSTLWAGPETLGRDVKSGRFPVQGSIRESPVSLKLGYSDDDYGYSIDLGLPIPSLTEFGHDPQIKAEGLWTGELLGRANAIALRAGPGVRIRDKAGQWREAYRGLAPFDSMMTHCAAPDDGIELLKLRERMRNWRFYDSPRTDVDAPSRRPRVGTYTPVLASDGGDLAAALQTIREIGDADGLARAIEDAFSGSTVSVKNMNGLLRPLKAAELSDGTLRYLLLVAALLSPRPPALMILNEPEASLHPDLLAPLARLIEQAAKQSQIVVVTHAPALVAELASAPAARLIRLEKQFGETIVEGHARPNWVWPSR